MSKSSVLIWRFNEQKAALVFRGHQALAYHIKKQAKAINMCVSGHETQILIPLNRLHRYAERLSLTKKQLDQLTKYETLIEVSL